MKNLSNNMCYLCGKNIDSCEEGNKDHIPPSQFFPPDLRKKLNPNLITLPSHKSCNSSYELDEAYFYSSCGVLTENSEIHTSIMKDLHRRLVENVRNNLLFRITSEFRDPIGGIVLPNNKVIKEVDTRRVNRIAWKIIRGLHFIEYKNIIPENTPSAIEFFQAGDILPDYSYWALKHTEIKGEYQGIFNYRHNTFSFIKNKRQAFVWGLGFWNSIIFIAKVCPNQ